MGTLCDENTMPQEEMILQYMKDFGSITPAEAMNEIGCYRLGARIWDLRHKRGYKIKSEMIKRTNRYGRQVVFAKYSLDEEDK